MGTSERNSHSRMSRRRETQRAGTVSGPAEASDWNSFYRLTRMTRLAQTKPGDDSLSARQIANGPFFFVYFSSCFFFFRGCDVLQVRKQLPM